METPNKKILKELLKIANEVKNFTKKNYLNYEHPSLISKSKLKKQKIKWQKISTNLRKSITPGPDRVAQRIKKKKSK